jgi:hypothetical protein
MQAEALKQSKIRADLSQNSADVFIAPLAHYGHIQSSHCSMNFDELMMKREKNDL